VSAPAWSTTNSFQVPAAILVLKADRGVSGLKEPVKGAVPALIAVAAESSNTVFVKLSPPEPRRLDRMTSVLSGPIT
jgi:hypothetical protein